MGPSSDVCEIRQDCCRQGNTPKEVRDGRDAQAPARRRHRRDAPRRKAAREDARGAPEEDSNAHSENGSAQARRPETRIAGSSSVSPLDALRSILAADPHKYAAGLATLIEKGDPRSIQVIQVLFREEAEVTVPRAARLIRELSREQRHKLMQRLEEKGIRAEELDEVTGE